jgi:glycosyltransferase involved in cell wall biosynthesis
MKISLVICTRDRATKLVQCLETLKGQDCPAEWELVVVDNGSRDETGLVLERFRPQFPAFVSVYESRPGLGRARNRGWRAARGEIVVFTDDDCHADPHLLTNYLTCFEGRGQLGFAGGRIVLHDPSDYPITIQTQAHAQEIAPRSFIVAGIIQGANFACRREALAMAGGFDEDFGAGARFPSEDVDLVARLSALGWAGAYDPRPLVSHDHGRKTEAEAIRLMRQYDRGRGAYYAKLALDPVMRAAYLRNWFWLLRHQPLGVTRRELAAAADYLYSRTAAAFASAAPGREKQSRKIEDLQIDEGGRAPEQDLAR